MRGVNTKRLDKCNTTFSFNILHSRVGVIKDGIEKKISVCNNRNWIADMRWQEEGDDLFFQNWESLVEDTLIQLGTTLQKCQN